MAKKTAENLVNKLKESSDMPPIENIYTSNLKIEHLLGTETFEELNIEKKIIKILYENNFDKPAAIQAVVIPNIKSGKSAVVQGDSGSGKTLSFIISALEILNSDPSNIVIILGPTRELIFQIEGIAKQFTDEMDIRTQVVLSGIDSYDEKARLFIGTPMSMGHLLYKGIIKREDVKLIIFDEGDKLLDFESDDAKNSLNVLNKLERDVQLLIVSATYSKNSEKFIEKLFQSRDVKNALFLFKKNAKPKEINLYNIMFEESENKMDRLLEPAHVLKEKSLIFILGNLSIGQAVVFIRTKNTAKILADRMAKELFSVSCLHGNLTHEERIAEIEKFRTAKTKILLTTDVFSRGIDIPQINLVINYDLPNIYENGKNTNTADPMTYLHRVGRAGRFGRIGFVIDFISGKSDFETYNDLKKNLNFESENITIPDLEYALELAKDDEIFS